MQHGEMNYLNSKLIICKPRQSVILLIDNSSAMIENGKINILNNSLMAFKNFIEESDILSKMIEVCVVSFGNIVNVIHNFSFIDDFNPPILKAYGPSLIGAGILKAQSLLMSRKYFFKKNAIDYYQPLIVFFCGSKPEDLFYNSRSWKKLSVSIKNDTELKKYHFISIAITPENNQYQVTTKNDEIYIEYPERTIVYEKNGEVRIIEIETEDDIKDRKIQPPNVNNCNEVNFTTCSYEQGHSDDMRKFLSNDYLYPYFHIINTLSPPNYPLQLLNKEADFKELFLQCRLILNDRFQVEDTLSLPNHKTNVLNSKENIKHHIILGASVIGPLHILNGSPCQDSFAYDILTSGHIVFTISDGLGSASLSEVGSRIAVDAAIETIIKEICNGSTQLELLVSKSVISARKTLEEKAKMLNCALRDLSCTIISVVLHEGSLGVGHIGDGAVVARRGSELIVVSEPDESEYANEVIPLTTKNWKEKLKISYVSSGISGVMAFSDGIQRAALRKLANGRIAYKGFCEPLFSFVEEFKDKNEMNDGEKELEEFLLSKKMAEHSEDDKTLIIAM